MSVPMTHVNIPDLVRKVTEHAEQIEWYELAFTSLELAYEFCNDSEMVKQVSHLLDQRNNGFSELPQRNPK